MNTQPNDSIYDLFDFYIEPADLRGQSHTVTIESAERREIYNPRARRNEPRLVVRFVGRKKAMCLNKTQAQAIMEISGTDKFKDWKGLTIILTPATQSGKDTIAISTAASHTETPAA
jgi:hypothetical protein